MKYERAEAVVTNFDNEDVIVTSGDDCGFTQWDAVYCDGVTQAVSKDQFQQECLLIVQMIFLNEARMAKGIFIVYESAFFLYVSRGYA